MFLNWQSGLIITPELDLSNVLFLYDPATNKDLVTGATVGVLRTGASVDSNILIDNHPTLKESTTNAGATITFANPIDLDSLNEWTIEWSGLPTSIGSAYTGEMLMNWSGGTLFGARWTDSGFGSRLQFSGGGFSNITTIWRLALTKALALNKLWRYAMVYKDGKISVYQNGVKQTVQNGSSGGTVQDYFTKVGTWGPMTTLYLGYYNTSYPSWLGNYGRVRISSVARYTSDYTPNPI